MWTEKVEQPILSSEKAKKMFNMAKNQKSYTPEFKQQNKKSVFSDTNQRIVKSSNEARGESVQKQKTVVQEEGM